MMTDTEKQAERDKLFGMFTDEKTTIEDLFKYVVIPFNQPEKKPGLWDIPKNIIRP